MAETTIRPAGPEDSETIAALANRLDVEEGGHGPFVAETVRRHGFGARPLFSVLLAERAGRGVGYAMIADIFNSERAMPGLWLIDLYVEPAARRSGVARRLMAAVAREGQARGARSLWLGVRNRNAAALAFYRRLGAADDDARILEFNGAALDRLADAVRAAT